MTANRAPSHDQRWGDHVPWSLKYMASFEQGDYARFCTLIGVRLSNFLKYSEVPIGHASQFVAKLSVESLGKLKQNDMVVADHLVKSFFSSESFSYELGNRQTRDALEKLFAGRLDVLQSFLILVSQHHNGTLPPSLVRDIRRIAAECDVMIDIKGHPPTLVPIEEPLLQQQVIDKLLPKLEAKYPERARDLIDAYNDLLRGEDYDKVFIHAYKGLEQLACELTGSKSFVLDDVKVLSRHFPNLHRTIRDTVIKLAAHRGDEAAHGRKQPDEYEIRYLLFTICNLALLFLEEKEHSASV